MPELEEVKYLKTNNVNGCSLCDATWGKYYRNIDGEKMLFCCNVCADIFENMVKKVKESTNWDKIDYINLNGNYNKGRECTAEHNDNKFKYYFRSNADGDIITFEKR